METRDWQPRTSVFIVFESVYTFVRRLLWCVLCPVNVASFTVISGLQKAPNYKSHNQILERKSNFYLYKLIQILFRMYPQ